MSIGGVLKVGTTDGQIAVSFTNVIEDTFNNGWDGCFRESVDFTVASDGATITGSLERSGGGDLTMIFSDGFSTLDCTPADTVTLTAGTDTNPQMNYIYVPASTKVLTNSTSGFPLEEHIKVADVYLRSATATQTEGSLTNRNWNDHVKLVGDNGHLLHLAEKLRQFEAQWDTGAAGTSTVVGPTPDDVYVSVTSGTVYQLHKQTFPALDSQTGDDIHIVNDSVSPFKTVTNLNGEVLDA